MRDPYITTIMTTIISTIILHFGTIQKEEEVEELTLKNHYTFNRFN